VRGHRDGAAMTAPKRAVVLGGSGFLGRRLVALLAGEAGPNPGWPRFDEIHVADIAPFVESKRLRGALERNGIELSMSMTDVTQLDEVRAAVGGAHTVFHLASLVDVGLRKNPGIVRINVEGTRNVVTACEEVGVPFLVYTSSEDVVLSTEPVTLGDESIPYPIAPIHDYVRTKIEAEKLVLAADGRSGLRTVSIRPVHIYGPDDPHAIGASLRALASGSVPFLLGSGRARFDVVYVDNVAHAHLLAAAKLDDESSRDRVGGQAFFIGEGNAPNYFDWLRPYAEARAVKMPKLRLPDAGVRALARLMELVHTLTGIAVPIHSFHYYILCRDFFFSNAKSEQCLGYRPLVPADEGRERTLAWVKSASFDD